MTDDITTEVERETGEGTDLWRVILPPAIWAGHFLVRYVAMAVACEKAGFAAGRSWVPWATVGALVALAAVRRRLWRVRARSQTADDSEFEHNTPEERHSFLSHVALMLCALSAVGVVYVALPVLVMETCR